MIETSFTRLVGATAPIQLAPMPGVAGALLVAAVANAGAVGMFPAAMRSAEALEEALARVARATRGVFGCGFLMPFLDLACVDVAARSARIVEFFYGEPDAGLVETAGARGAVVGWQVGSVEEAVAAENAGCRYVVVQGTEAGGHVRGHTSLLPLLARVLDATSIPLVAAGGLATAGDLAAVLAAGAGAARMGTRFVAAAESEAHPTYVQALLAASACDTELTEAFSGLWPDAPHRVLRSAIAAAEYHPEAVVGEARFGGQVVPIQRFSALCPSSDTTGHIEAMALYAGESVTNVNSIEPAGEIVAKMAAGAERALLAAAG